MAIHRVSFETKELNPEFAAEVLSENVWGGQRNKRPDILKNLKNKIDEGLFLTGRIVYALEGWNNNNQVLVNGQHQAHAVLEKKITLPASVEVYRCDTPDDVVALYNQIDGSLGAKKSLDYAKVMIHRLGVNWTAKTGEYLISGKYWLIHNSSRALTLDLKQDEMTWDDVPIGDYIYGLIRKDHPVRHIMRTPVLAAIFHSWTIDEDDCKDFWSKVATGSEMEEEDPRFMLFMYLRDHDKKKDAAKAAKAERTFALNAWNLMQYNKCAAAWNAYRDGRKTRLTVRKTSERLAFK